MQTMLIVLYSVLLPIIALYTEGITRGVLLYLHACGLMVWCHASPHPRDMYGLKHFRLNLQLPPRTFWCNTGYWTKDSTDFVAACERLVLTVANKLNIQAGDRLLDVGYGCGDSCFLISDRYDCKVTGITNEHAQWKFSQERKLGLAQAHQDKLVLLEGSAVELPKALGDSKLFDHIVSIDSAYHYNTRRVFFSQAKDYLKPGGKLALSDLVLHDKVKLQTGWKRVFLKLVCFRLSLPIDNLVDQATYRTFLEQAGFHDIKFEPLPPQQVFGGVSRHIKQQKFYLKKWNLGNWQDRFYLTTSSFLFGKLATKDWLVPMVITASVDGE